MVVFSQRKFHFKNDDCALTWVHIPQWLVSALGKISIAVICGNGIRSAFLDSTKRFRLQFGIEWQWRHTWLSKRWSAMDKYLIKFINFPTKWHVDISYRTRKLVINSTNRFQKLIVEREHLLQCNFDGLLFNLKRKYSNESLVIWIVVIWWRMQWLCDSFSLRRNRNNDILK